MKIDGNTTLLQLQSVMDHLTTEKDRLLATIDALTEQLKNTGPENTIDL